MWWKRGELGRAEGIQARRGVQGPSRHPGCGLQTRKSTPDISGRVRGEDKHVGEEK